MEGDAEIMFVRRLVARFRDDKGGFGVEENGVNAFSVAEPLGFEGFSLVLTGIDVAVEVLVLGDCFL